MTRCARCSGELPQFAVFCPHCAQAHEPDFDQLTNLTIDGRYRIYRPLGRGGLSTIFGATDLETDRVVVVKISDPAQLVRREMSYAIDTDNARGYWAEMLERMRREAETLTGIDHPNIVRFYGTGLIGDDLRYVVMEFLRGRTLREEIDRRGSFESSWACRIALEVAHALSEVHSRGIVHRDISPRNIFLCEDSVKLIDFGIAKFPQPPGAPPFTRHSSLIGAVAYASPEQCGSRLVDHRSDIYSLGAALYEMLTGERPFNGRTPTEVALKQIQSEPKPPRAINPAIPPRLEKAVLRALAKNPDQRQQTVEELADELRASLNQIVIPLPSTAIAEPNVTLVRGEMENIFDNDGEPVEEGSRVVRRRRRRFAVATATLLLAVFTSALLFGWPLISSKRKAPGATEGAGVTALSSPDAAGAAIGSDADSLELAARMSSLGDGGNPVATMQPSPASAAQAQPPPGVASKATGSGRTIARTTIPPTPAPVPTPTAPKARPQMPPAPAPDITIAREPQPASEPDLAQAPRKERDDGGWQRENDTATNNPNRNPNSSGDHNSDRDSGREDDRKSNRNRNRDEGDYRRPSDSRNRDNRSDDDDDDDSPRIGPKLIQWSGRVNYEREITIEMPGVPGTVDIPRVYRDRVGVIEPPTANNRWRCAVLRVFGKGNVSIVIRWWPAASRVARLSVKR